MDGNYGKIDACNEPPDGYKLQIEIRKMAGVLICHFQGGQPRGTADAGGGGGARRRIPGGPNGPRDGAFCARVEAELRRARHDNGFPEGEHSWYD